VFAQITQYAENTDILGNKYVIEQAKLTKFLPDSTIFVYQNKQLSQISFVDVSNPFGILLFYRDFNTVVILDENLAQYYSLNLQEYGIEASAVCLYSSEEIIIFDEVTTEMIFFDIINQKINTKKYIDVYEHINFIIYQNNKIYLFSDNKVYIYDCFGNLLKVKKIDVLSWCFENGLWQEKL
jgi:hypothetical protein